MGVGKTVCGTPGHGAQRVLPASCCPGACRRPARDRTVAQSAWGAERYFLLDASTLESGVELKYNSTISEGAPGEWRPVRPLVWRLRPYSRGPIRMSRFT